MNLYFKISISLVLSSFVVVSAQQSAQISIPFKVYDNAGGQMILYFGLDQTATDDIDIHLGESELPPYPPSGVFEARWFLPENNFNGSQSSWSDYRYASKFPYSGTIEYRVRFQVMEEATAIYFNWIFPSEVTGLLQDVINGNIVNVQLSGSGVYELTDFIYYNPLKLIVTYNNIVTKVEENHNLPNQFRLNQNYPNPFNPSTTIKFAIPESSIVTLSIYNSLGQKVAELVNEKLDAGWYSYKWDAGNIASGIYIYELKTNKSISTKKMILMK